jgi:hypothetical protein
VRLLRAGALWVGILGAAAGCEPDDQGPVGIEFRDLSGRWSYSATFSHGTTLTCEIDDLPLEFAQIPGTGSFSGSLASGSMRCSDAVSTHQVPLEGYPVVDGYTFNEFVSFHLYTKEWRHGGLIVRPDSLDGDVQLMNGGVRYEGRFSAVRRR